MNKIIFTILIFSLVLSGCAFKKTEISTTPQQNREQLGLANPASVFCVEQGGESEIREAEDGGQYGVCVFSDGSECEEWAFYRLECKPSDTEQETQNIKQGNDDNDSFAQENDIQIGNENIKIFDIKAGDNISSPVTIRGEGRAFENNLIIELRNNNYNPLVREHTTIKSDEVGKIGPFEITLNFNFANTKEGYIAVYEESAQDGSELNLVEIPVKFNNKENDL